MTTNRSSRRSNNGPEFEARKRCSADVIELVDVGVGVVVVGVVVVVVVVVVVIKP